MNELHGAARAWRPRLPPVPEVPEAVAALRREEAAQQRRAQPRLPGGVVGGKAAMPTAARARWRQPHRRQAYGIVLLIFHSCILQLWVLLTLHFLVFA